MAMKCESCGKGVMHGHNVSHSKRRTQKIFKPNLHVARIMIGSNRVKTKLCTKCLRVYKKVEAALREDKAAAQEKPQQTPATA